MRKRSLFERLMNRVGFTRAPQRRSFFAGAAGNRLNLDWVLGPSSADDEVKADGRKLRDRARQLRRDNPWAARYVSLQVEGILGAHGITFQARVGTTRGSANSRVNELLEQRFRDWCERYADIAGRHSFGEHARLAVETWKTEGEAFVELVPTTRNPYGLALRALDPDQIDDTLNQAPAEGVPEIKMGVELDPFGAPVAFHVWTRHPSESINGSRQRRRVPASQIIHLGRASRAGQTRFVTPFAPVLQDLKMLGGLQEAVLVLQRTAACKMGFVSVDPELTSPLTPDAGESAVNWDAEPGRIEQLPAGMQFTPWDPGQPGAEYDPFTKNVLRAIAGGLGVSYASLTGDLSEANYSSARVGMLSERDGYARDQQYLIAALHRRVYAAWLEWAFLSGALPELTPGDASKYPADWTPRPFPWIDPQKDIEASLLEVAAGVNSLTDIAASQGRDFADVIAKRKAELALADEAGVKVTLGPAEPPPAPLPPTDTQTPADRAALRLARAANG